MNYILTTNRSTFKFVSDQIEKCTFCDTHSESIKYLFWKRHYVKEFLKNIANTIENSLNITHFKFSLKPVIFWMSDDHDNSNLTFSFIVLMAKFYLQMDNSENQRIVYSSHFISFPYLRFEWKNACLKQSKCYQRHFSDTVHFWKDRKHTCFFLEHEWLKQIINMLTERICNIGVNYRIYWIKGNIISW